MSENTNVLDLELYFKLKNKYETLLNKKKSKIKKTIKDKNEQKKLIKSMELKCVNCNQSGGTLFSMENGFLIAKCKATQDCGFNLKIQKGKIENYKLFSKTNKKKLDTIKEKIIQNKLKLLYNLENEEVILAEFETLKSEYQEESMKEKTLNLFIQSRNIVKLTDFLDQDDILLLNRVSSLNDDGEAKDSKQAESKSKYDILNIDDKDIILKGDEPFIDRYKLVSVLNGKLDNFIKTFRELLIDYRNSETHEKIILTNALKIYTENIVLLEKKIMTLKYNEIFVEERNISSGGFGKKPVYEYILNKSKHSVFKSDFIAAPFRTLEKNINQKAINKAMNKTMRKGQKKLMSKIKLSSDETKTVEGDLIDEMDALSPVNKDIERPDLYDDSTIFIFWSGSQDKPPGKGKSGGGERIADESKFQNLGEIKHWRKVLSNMYIKSDKDGKILPLFELGGLKWASVEHYYHASKYNYYNIMEEGDENYNEEEVRVGREFYRKFSLDSNSEFCKNPKLALSVGGRSGKLMGKKYRPSILKMDPTYFTEEKNVSSMLEAQRAKYSQDEFSKNVLMETKDAKLVHLEKKMFKKSKLVTFNNTMEIRESFKDKEGFEKISLRGDAPDDPATAGGAEKTVVDDAEDTIEASPIADDDEKTAEPAVEQPTADDGGGESKASVKSQKEE